VLYGKRLRAGKMDGKIIVKTIIDAAASV